MNRTYRLGHLQHSYDIRSPEHLLTVAVWAQAAFARPCSTKQLLALLMTMARKTEKIESVPMGCNCGVVMEICKGYEAWCARSQGADYSQGQLYCTKCCDEWPGSKHYTPAKIKEHCSCLHKWQRGQDEGQRRTTSASSSSVASSTFQIVPLPPTGPNIDAIWQRILDLESQIQGLNDKLMKIIPSPPPDPNNDVMWQRILGLESQIEGLSDKLNNILHHLWGYQ